jgi:hypothetical protein
VHDSDRFSVSLRWSLAVLVLAEKHIVEKSGKNRLNKETGQSDESLGLITSPPYGDARG